MEYKGLKIKEVKMGKPTSKAKISYQVVFPAKFFSKKQVNSGLLESTNIRRLLNKIDAQIKYWKTKK